MIDRLRFSRLHSFFLRAAICATVEILTASLRALHPHLSSSSAHGLFWQRLCMPFTAKLLTDSQALVTATTA